MKCWWCWKEVEYLPVHETESEALQRHAQICQKRIAQSGIGMTAPRVRQPSNENRFESMQ